MDCDGTYECCADEYAAGCLSADLDPSTEHGLRPVGDWLQVAPDAWVELDGPRDERW